MKKFYRNITEARVYVFWLIYARMVLAIFFAAPLGLLIYSIITLNAGAATASVVVGLSFVQFYQGVGSRLLRGLRHRWECALVRQG